MWWLVVIVLALLIPEIISTVLDSRLGRAVAAHLENRGPSGDAEGLARRIVYLEGEVDRLAQDLHRLSEESEFFQKLLAERSSGRKAPPPPGDRTS